MHIVTKILVVLAAVLSILLAALSVAYTANAERIRNDYLSVKADAQAANTAKSISDSTYAQQVERLGDEMAALKSEIARLESDKANLQRDNSQLMARVKEAEVNADGVLARIDQLAATAETQANLLAAYRGEVTGLRENELRYAQREIDLADRINDLGGQLEVAQETNRALQEQIAELQRVTGTSGPALAQQAGSTPFRARVTDVRRDPGSNAMLASIDAGSNDRLRENMELTITRNNEFIGKLVLQTVYLNEAIGRVDFLGRSGEVRQGDAVVSVVR